MPEIKDENMDAPLLPSVAVSVSMTIVDTVRSEMQQLSEMGLSNEEVMKATMAGVAQGIGMVLAILFREDSAAAAELMASQIKRQTANYGNHIERDRSRLN
jgi:hypothetical protein